jgi:hypothetical protein
MSSKGGSMQASLQSVYEMFRDEESGGTGVSRSRCRAFLWATGHEVNDEQALDQIMLKYTGGGAGSGTGVADSCVRACVRACVRCIRACGLPELYAKRTRHCFRSAQIRPLARV